MGIGRDYCLVVAVFTALALPAAAQQPAKPAAPPAPAAASPAPTAATPAAPAVAAPNPQPIKDPKAFATEFMNQLQKNESQAYDSLKSTGLTAAGVDNLKQTAARVANSIGPVIGSDFVEEEHLGKRVTRLLFVSLHQRGPTVHSMIFYAPPTGTDWQLIAVDMTAEPERFPFPPILAK
jgi:hypothetical protein